MVSTHDRLTERYDHDAAHWSSETREKVVELTGELTRIDHPHALERTLHEIFREFSRTQYYTGSVESERNRLLEPVVAITDFLRDLGYLLETDHLSRQEKGGGHA